MRREDVAAALLRNQSRLNAGLGGSDMGMVNTHGGKAVDVTMVRGDGTLIR